MYVAVRRDLAPGLAAAQVAHAAFGFAVEHPEITERWHRDSSFLVIVSVPDEEQLKKLADLATSHELLHELVLEPDLGDEATALALEPGDIARRLCSELPLALRDVMPVAA